MTADLRRSSIAVWGRLKPLWGKSYRGPYLRTSYAELVSAFDTPGKLWWAGAGLVTFMTAPLWVPPYFVHLLNLSAIGVVGAVGLNFVTGWAGQVSLGHAAFLAVGAYTAAIMTLHLPWPLNEFAVVVPTATLAATLAGFLLGLPALRLRGLYLALSTIAFHYVLLYGARRYHAYLSHKFTQSTTELVLPVPRIGGWVLADERSWYLLSLVVVVGVLICATNIARTRAGRAWFAIRQRDVAAAVMGVNVVHYKLLAFALSASLAGLAGSLMAYYQRGVSADNFTLGMSIQYVAMIVIGGMGSVLGSVLGAAFVTLLPHIIRLGLNWATSGRLDPTVVSGVEFIVFGVIMWWFLRYEPEGLAAVWLRIRRFVELWPFSYRPLERRV